MPDRNRPAAESGRAVEPDVAVAGPPGPRLHDWNLLRSFLAIYETGTLTQAAHRLGSTQPNMGRHLRELEASIGETLFVRRPGKLQANERADALFQAVQPMLAAIRDAERVFTGAEGEIIGVVRVAMLQVDLAAKRPGLRRVLADRVRLVDEVWLCAHEELRRSRRMRYVWDHLGESLERELAGDS